MNEKLDLAATAFSLGIAEILAAIMDGVGDKFKEPYGIDHDAFENFFIMVGELPMDDKTGTIFGIYTIALMTPKSNYPHDIMDIIHSTNGIEFRFQGLQIPAVIFPATLVMDQPNIDAMFGLIIKSDEQLRKIILEHGGKNETKRTRK